MTRRGNTQQRSIRIGADLWARTQTQAAAEGLDFPRLYGNSYADGWTDETGP